MFFLRSRRCNVILIWFVGVCVIVGGSCVMCMIMSVGSVSSCKLSSSHTILDVNAWITSLCRRVEGNWMLHMNSRPRSSEYREDWGSFFSKRWPLPRITECQNMVLLVTGYVIFLCYKNYGAGLRDVMGIWGSEFCKERVLDRKVPRTNCLPV
jgi:hypothetical protein